MLRLAPLACFLAATIGSTIAAPATKDAEPKVVQNLDLIAYAGRWYQMYASPSVYATFERNAKCVTADYTINDYDVYNETPEKTTFSVRNYNQDKDTNKGTEINGTATIAAPGKLKVDFGAANMGPPSTEPNYWILAVGPLIYDSEYAWAIVSNSDRSMLYILARREDNFAKKYSKQVLALAKKLGFTTETNKPVATVHDKTCVYPKDDNSFELPADLLLALAALYQTEQTSPEQLGKLATLYGNMKESESASKPPAKKTEGAKSS